MPTTTPIYKFPAPTAAEASDGPAAFSALNSRVEREIPVYRGQTVAEAEGSQSMGFSPTYSLMQTSDHAMSIIGWAAIDCEIAISSIAGAATNIAGFWRILGNGTVLTTGRWHNYASTALIRVPLATSVAIAAATTNLTVRVEIAADGSSSGALVRFVRTSVRRYGAPATG